MAAAKDVSIRLDEALSRPGAPVDADVAPLVILANQIRAMSRVQPRADFVDALDRQLRRQAEARARARPSPQPQPLLTGLQQWALRGAGVALVTAALMLAGWGTVQAAHGSVPGSPFYPLKRALEGIQIALTHNPSDQVALHLELLETRLEEAIALAEAGHDVPPGLLAEASGNLGAIQQIGAVLPLEHHSDVADRLQAALERQQGALTAAIDKVDNPRADQALQHAQAVSCERLQQLIEDFGGTTAGCPADPGPPGKPADVPLGPPEGVPGGGPDATGADFIQNWKAELIEQGLWYPGIAAEAAQERKALHLAAQFGLSEFELSLLYQQCAGNWGCVHKALQEMAREQRGTGRPENAGAQGQGQGQGQGQSQGQGNPEDPGPPFDDGPPGPPGDGPPGPSSSRGRS